MTDICEIMRQTAAMTEISGCIAFTKAGEIIQSDLQESVDPKNLSYWALAVYLNSDMVAKKSYGYHQEFDYMTLLSNQGGLLIVPNNNNVIVALTDNTDAAAICDLASKITAIARNRNRD